MLGLALWNSASIFLKAATAGGLTHVVILRVVPPLPVDEVPPPPPPPPPAVCDPVAPQPAASRATAAPAAPSWRPLRRRPCACFRMSGAPLPSGWVWRKLTSAIA